METEKLQNWNQLEYAKYSFWQDSIYIGEKTISIFVYLEIQYKDSENPHIIINTEVVVDNKGLVRATEESIIRLNNLFRLDNLSYFHLYLLPLEDKMIKIALRYAEKKIDQYLKVDGENL
jgi:hypothetical protein